KAEEKQREQEAKQEEAQAKAEAAQRERQEEQGRLQTEQELRQEQLLTEQEKREAEQRAEVEARQAEAQARQEAAVEQAQAAHENAGGRQLPGLDRPGSVDLPGGQLNPGDLPGGHLNPGDLTSLMPDPIGGPVYSDNGLTMPDGSATTIDDHGRIVTHHPDGSTVTIDPDLHTATVTRPDGTSTTGPLNIGDRLPHSDGSVSHIGADGRIVTDHPDGTTTTIDPDTGIGITTRPDGTEISGHLNGDGALPAGPGSHSSLPGVSRPSSHDGSLGSYEEELYDHTPYQPSFAGSASGPAPAHGALGDIGTPLNTGSLPGSGAGSPAGPMGTPMGGMGGPMGGMGGGGGGGGGGGSGTSERVRNVIDDGRTNGGPRGGRPRAGSPRGVQEENDVRVSAPRTATTTGASPFAPMGGAAPGGQQTQSGDRTRDAWVQEEEDVWGTDEGGAPAVIGR
ncbi:microtubule/TRAF3 and DISC1 binding protein, partial [Streptomyces sp. NPDC060010]